MVNNSNQTFFIQLALWTVANGISMIAVWALLFSIFRNPRVRKSPFNLYLAFCVLPDAYKSLAGFCANLANMLMDDGSPNACTVIGWNDAYWWCANLWMAVSVFWQIHRMLVANRRARRYKPPTRKRITTESCIIHVFSVAMAMLTVIPADVLPKAVPASGCEAFPEPGHRSQTIFYWAFFLPVTALVPTLIVTGLCLHIWWKGLLPPKGEKSRSLLFYYARLLAVVYIVVVAVVVSFFFHSWVQAIAFMVFNLVGLFQVVLALFKNDVRKSWVQMWTCKKPEEVSGSRVQSESSYGMARPAFTFLATSNTRPSWIFRASTLRSARGTLRQWMGSQTGHDVSDRSGDAALRSGKGTIPHGMETGGHDTSDRSRDGEGGGRKIHFEDEPMDIVSEADEGCEDALAVQRASNDMRGRGPDRFSGFLEFAGVPAQGPTTSDTSDEEEADAVGPLDYEGFLDFIDVAKNVRRRLSVK
ncbi:hypothetical protein ACHAWF_007448 [Thalassiosira exigua]